MAVFASAHTSASMQPPPTVPATSPFWKKSIFAPRCCGVEPRVCATVATTTRSPRSLASLISRYNSRCGMVDMELCASSFVFAEQESTSPRLKYKAQFQKEGMMEDERQYYYHPGPSRFVLFAGVIMPAIAITLEATSHICADVFFDPIPTTWHLLLVIVVPLAQLQVWFAIRRRSTDGLALAGILNAVAMGISLFYSVVYLPLVPLAILALLFGLGLLPLAPFLSLLASLIMRHHLKRAAGTGPQKSFAVKTTGLLAGLVLTAAIIGMVELPSTLTTIGLQMASSASPQMRNEGIRFLREYGSNDALLRSCYGRTGWATDLIGSAFSIKNPVTNQEAQKIYYRVT